MRAFIWRIVIAAIAVVMFWLIVPLFLDVIGFNVGGSLLQLMKICIACIAVIYVVWGSDPGIPWP